MFKKIVRLFDKFEDKVWGKLSHILSVEKLACRTLIEYNRIVSAGRQPYLAK